MCKKIISLLLVWMCIVGGVLLLQACYSGATSSASDVVNTHAQTSRLHKGTAKPGASVIVANVQPILLNTVGVHHMVLVLRSQDYPGEMQVTLASGDGVTFLSSTQPALFPLTESGEYHLPVSVNIEQEGRQYLRLNVRVSSGDITEQRAVSVILQVGEVRPKLQKTGSANASDTVISLPAQEHVSPQD